MEKSGIKRTSLGKAKEVITMLGRLVIQFNNNVTISSVELDELTIILRSHIHLTLTNLFIEQGSHYGSRLSFLGKCTEIIL